MKVVVMGQGYVGLPLAMRAVEVGHDVVGYDGGDPAGRKVTRLSRPVRGRPAAVGGSQERGSVVL